MPSPVVQRSNISKGKNDTNTTQLRPLYSDHSYNTDLPIHPTTLHPQILKTATANWLIFFYPLDIRLPEQTNVRPNSRARHNTKPHFAVKGRLQQRNMLKYYSPEQLPRCSVLMEVLDDYPGLYFYPKKPITRNIDIDNAVVEPLLDADRRVSNNAVLTSLTRIMQDSNKSWASLVRGGPSAYWLAVSQLLPTQMASLTPATLEHIILAMVKGRARFLVRFPQKDPEHADSMLVAYAQLLLNSLKDLGRDNIAGQPLAWRLIPRDIAAAKKGTEMRGPLKAETKKSFVLSPYAKNLLQPVGEFGRKERERANLMGLARDIVGGQQPQAGTSSLGQGNGAGSGSGSGSGAVQGNGESSGSGAVQGNAQSSGSRTPFQVPSTPPPSAGSATRRRPRRNAVTPTSSPLMPRFRTAAQRRAASFWPPKTTKKKDDKSEEAKKE